MNGHRLERRKPVNSIKNCGTIPHLSIESIQNRDIRFERSNSTQHLLSNFDWILQQNFEWFPICFNRIDSFKLCSIHQRFLNDWIYNRIRDGFFYMFQQNYSMRFSYSPNYLYTDPAFKLTKKRKTATVNNFNYISIYEVNHIERKYNLRNWKRVGSRSVGTSFKTSC